MESAIGNGEEPAICLIKGLGPRSQCLEFVLGLNSGL